LTEHLLYSLNGIIFESQVSFKQVVSEGCGINFFKKMLVDTIIDEGLKPENVNSIPLLVL